MRRIKVFLTVFGLLTISLSCSRHSEMDYSLFLKEAGFEVDNEEFMLVIPQNGCSTCVKKSYSFLLKNYESPKIKYVFTHYSSQKAIKVRLNVLGKEDVSRIGFIDLRVALENGLSQMYPSLLEIGKDGKAKVTFMNAEDGSDWQWLEEQME